MPSIVRINPTTYSNAIKDLEIRPRYTNQSTKVLLIYETLQTLFGDSTITKRDIANRLVSLLSDRDTIMLAQIVIPELREIRVHSQNPLRNTILQANSELRDRIGQAESTKLSDYNIALYRVEKDVYYEVDLYRVRLILLQSEAFDPDEKQAL